MANSLMQALGGMPQMGNNPITQVINMLNGKSQQEINDYIKNTAQQRGVNLTQLAQNIGMPKEVATRYGIEIK